MKKAHVQMRFVRMIKMTYLIAMFLMLSSGASAQGSDYCLPDCENDAWGQEQSVTYQLSPTCTVTIYYSTRYACSTFHDVFIRLIESPNLLACLGFNTSNAAAQALFDQIIEKLLMDNPMGFPPFEDDCDPPVQPGQPRQCCEDNWRVIKGSCWEVQLDTGLGEGVDKSREGSQSGQDFLRSCDDEICCLDRYEVCVTEEDGQWVKTITHTTPTPQEDCDPLPNRCWPACGHGSR